MCYTKNDQMTKHWKARYRPKETVLVYKVLTIRKGELLSEVFRVPFKPGLNVAQDHDGSNSVQVGIHCYLTRRTATNIWGGLDHDEVVVEFEAQANDLIGIGPNENHAWAVNTALFSQVTLSDYEYKRALNEETNHDHA